MKNSKSSYKLPLSIALLLTITCSLLVAQEGPLPENPGIAGPDQADNEAQEGMDIEEGLNPVPAPEVSEAQQSFANDKAEEDEEIKKEEADAEKEEADAEYTESFEPEEPITPVDGEAVVEPRVVLPE
jgi:hypothetical protein